MDIDADDSKASTSHVGFGPGLAPDEPGYTEDQALAFEEHIQRDHLRASSEVPTEIVDTAQSSEPKSTPKPKTKISMRNRNFPVVKVRDFGFPPHDPRHGDDYPWLTEEEGPAPPSDAPPDAPPAPPELPMLPMLPITPPKGKGRLHPYLPSRRAKCALTRDHRVETSDLDPATPTPRCRPLTRNDSVSLSKVDPAQHPYRPAGALMRNDTVRMSDVEPIQHPRRLTRGLTRHANVIMPEAGPSTLTRKDTVSMSDVESTHHIPRGLTRGPTRNESVAMFEVGPTRNDTATSSMSDVEFTHRIPRALTRGLTRNDATTSSMSDVKYTQRIPRALTRGLVCLVNNTLISLRYLAWQMRNESVSMSDVESAHHIARSRRRPLAREETVEIPVFGPARPMRGRRPRTPTRNDSVSMSGIP
ncbi:hypothetical protein FB451DRAFT_1251964 [Mycena latifolia]|nr:hypothetical protein FB451DRAFT_1251964 [Mycena latifolia]